jgi:plastocyanin
MQRLTRVTICFLTFVGIGLNVSSVTADDKDRRGNVTVSFGQWDPNPNTSNLLPAEVPLDRLAQDPAMGRGNNHDLLPKVVKINVGDAVNYIISGNHVVAIYDDGTKPESIGGDVEPNCAFPLPTTITTPCSPVNAAGAPQAGGILSDSTNRIYRGTIGADRRDGVEVVQFTKPGTYLVICARKTHFENDDMFGFVVVKEDKHRK